MRYVIIGGGIAGTTAAEELRKIDAESEIVLVSEEQHVVYSRVLLPHFMKGKVPRERVFLKSEEWYQEKSIEWIRGEMVVSLDTTNRFVTLTNGREIEYDKLLLATGGEVRTVLDDVRGVSYFRTLDDADHFMQLIAELPEGARGAVYGGGFIACEYLNLYRHFEMPMTLAMRGAHFWTKSLLPEVGAMLNDFLVEQGVELHANAPLESLVGEKQLSGFVAGGTEIACDVLGVGIGIETDRAWLEEAGVEIGTGIKADAMLRTNVEDVFTAGDVAEYHDETLGRQLVVGNWMSAMMQGRHVAKVMGGEEVPFALVSSYATNVFGLEMIFVGDTSIADADEVVLVGGNPPQSPLGKGGGMPSVTQLFGRDGRLVGGVMIGRNTDRGAITTGIKTKISVSECQQKLENA